MVRCFSRLERHSNDIEGGEQLLRDMPHCRNHGLRPRSLHSMPLRAAFDETDNSERFSRHILCTCNYNVCAVSTCCQQRYINLQIISSLNVENSFDINDALN